MGKLHMFKLWKSRSCALATSLEEQSNTKTVEENTSPSCKILYLGRHAADLEYFLPELWPW